MLYHVALLSILLSSETAFAFDYFNSRIDYWNKDRKTIPPAAPPAGNQEKHPSPTPKAAFDWNKQLNPSNDEFFREGDYLPPAPFLELVRDPSDQNIKNWFKLMEKKNELSERLNKKIQEYLAKTEPADKMVQADLRSKISEVKPQASDYERFRFRLYFHSSCPHCKHMMSTMKRLQDLGYMVEIVQVDDDVRAAATLPFPVRRATKEEIEEKNLNAWPVLFVGDLEKKIVYRINGYQTTETVLQTLREKA